jgi:glycosyltransferase A (GT-A) superfamily protein (DUF2064 family)
MHVLVMAKAPVPGRVKTRLCPPCSLDEAATIARAALADTLEAVVACHAERKIVALDGEPGDWLPSGVEVIPQHGDGLADRLAHAWMTTRWATGGWGIQIGMDTPQVTAADLDGLLGLLRLRNRGGRRSAVLGPAVDGGWWVVGLPGTDPHLVFSGVPMSTPDTGNLQRRRLRQLGLDVLAAPTRRDIDRIGDLRAHAAAAPYTRTSRAAAKVLARGMSAVAAAPIRAGA